MRSIKLWKFMRVEMLSHSHQGKSSGSLRNGGDTAFHVLPSAQTKSKHLSLGWALWLVSSSNEGLGFWRSFFCNGSPLVCSEALNLTWEQGCMDALWVPCVCYVIPQDPCYFCFCPSDIALTFLLRQSHILKCVCHLSHVVRYAQRVSSDIWFTRFPKIKLTGLF